MSSPYDLRTIRGVELRLTATDGAIGIVSGHAAVFDQLSEDLGGFRERIAPGAFTKSLSSADIRAFWNHNSDYVLGRSGAGTLRLSEDSRGLAFEFDPPANSWGRDAAESIRRGDVDQMSFGFRTIDDKWTKAADGSYVRTLLEVELLEVSPVVFPAYPQTGAALSQRSLDALRAAATPDPTGRPPAAIALRRRRLEIESWR
ncbi:HK97 family phage prohead protease [Plasticicumulans acidivorans]|uniref:Prohead serine protease domain-containing protein n=1 Tax=Plasticicumulans acidivorans TaxID=886464 RepID=A0A317N2E3_9GAMM|nr:HK97 family phage prohead protease [Plasticicumulans acidivorans]PWV66008.1 hypothetical protein C7443_101496 [Plasticicumulans acidivorans]